MESLGQNGDGNAADPDIAIAGTVADPTGMSRLTRDRHRRFDAALPDRATTAYFARFSPYPHPETL